MRIIGCDLHARQETLAMLDTITGEVVNRTLLHEGSEVREFYSQLPRPVLLGIEAIGPMQWFLDLLEELGIEYQVGDATKIRAAEPRKQKEEPLPAARAAQGASGTYASGKTVPGKWHVYREMAAGGLWTTPTDLANFAIEIALPKQGKSNRILTKAMTRELLKPQVDRVGEVSLGDSQHVDRMGLGFFLGDASRPDLFGHIGDDEGFQAMLVMYADSGQGAAIMANSANGILLGDLVLSLIAKEYGWKNFVASERPRIGSSAVLLSAAHQKGVEAAIQAYWQLKKMHSPQYGLNLETLIGLGYSLLAEGKLQDAIEVMKLEVREYPAYWNAYDSLGELYMNAGETKLAIENYQKSLELNPNNHGGIEALKRLKAKS